ncbi:STAS domain-containing protein [Saccharomonospora azurea]|uniref:Anti-anti-sigma regulatory factor (Antagonist of anti-sigma factor) n=1 Tax=Saccharomonospora azurea NA-128 TaxID=882081 RepID=H8G7B0_9PSEU|nr:STAS domain-containing protein [Saccharomonospora azurea]EHY88349.1 anti-anti-sigma regulatory factor (antagonist of anti-sigma factor) [Saccharomonospora azurea NA-128]
MACRKDLVDVRIDRPAIGLVVVRVTGEVDILGAPTVRQCIDTSLPSARAFVLDLSDTTFFGAAGLSVLVHVSALAERLSVRWALVGSTAVLRPLRVTNLERELPVCRDFSAAVLAAATSPAMS